MEKNLRKKELCKASFISVAQTHTRSVEQVETKPFYYQLIQFQKGIQNSGESFYTCDKKEFKHFEFEVREKKKIKYLNRSHGIIGTDVALFGFRTVRLARGLVALISR